MTAKSFWFQTGVSGDGSSEYTEADHSRWVRVLGACFGWEGVAVNFGDDFNATANPVSGSDETVRIGMGGAIVDGKPLDQDVAEDHVLTTTPSFRRDRVVLKADWSTRTVRIVVLEGTDGSETPPTIPAPVPGTTVYIALWQVRLTSAGAVTLSADERVFARNDATVVVDDDTIEISGGELRVKDSGITLAKLAAAVANELVTNGDSHNHDGGDGDPIDSGAIAAGAVDTSELASNAVDDTKVGNRVPQFYRRQGGSSSDWDVVGTSSYTPTTVRMQAGVRRWTGGAATSGWVQVTFPTSFSNKPIVLASPHQQGVEFFVTVGGISDTGVQLYWYTRDGSTTRTQCDIYWIATGPQ